jgi:hypothetical protein
VSTRAVDVFQRYQISGIEFEPVKCSPSNTQSDQWMQMVVLKHDAHLVSPIVAGEKPFEDPRGQESQQYRCPLGHRLGLNLISEAYVERASWTGEDIVLSQEYFGARMGLLRPHRLALVSHKVRKAIEKKKLRGVTLEIAHLV